MAVVETRDLTKVFKEGQLGAVNNVTFETREGEFLVFLGPSGSGKTTLLRMIAGLETPSSGEILIGGKVVNDLSPPFGIQKHCLPIEGPKREERASQRKSRMGGVPLGHRRPPRSQATRALWRRASAGGPGPRNRARTRGFFAR